jgi:DNA-binding MarR family transcriptional regulator
LPNRTITLPDEDLLFRLLRQLDAAPEASQRATAEALGVSLGRLNALLRAATDAGLVQIIEKQSTDRRQRAAYLLTPQGATEKIPELYVSYDSAQKLKVEAADLPSWDLTPRQICDLELLMNGGFNPLKGFLGRGRLRQRRRNMRWPTARSGRCRSRSMCPRPSPTRSNPARTSRCATGGRDPRHPVRHRQVDARQGARGRKVFGADDRRIRRSTTCTTPRARSTSAARSPASSRRCTTISAPAATRRTSCAPISASSAGAASSPSRPATRCTARTRN